MNAVLPYRTQARSCRSASWTWVPLLGMALLLIGCAEAQTEQAEEQSAPTAEQPAPLKEADASTLQAKEMAAAAAKDRKAEDKDSGCGTDDKTPFPPPELDQSQAGTPRYVCAKKQVESKPVWAGERLTFSFTIGNQGTGDLAVKLKGG
ncbi:MAG: hypothetical protein JSU68_13485 [Phycisphaerales bacterium]|nr:MAG: hypothetical protein JSU68_13485 [Phycisphaerales bacterium]